MALRKFPMRETFRLPLSVRSPARGQYVCVLDADARIIAEFHGNALIATMRAEAVCAAVNAFDGLENLEPA